MTIENEIAVAIKKADSSYFFENYSAQAKAVIKALNKAGYAVVPKEPTEAMLEAGKRVVTSGRVRPSDFVKSIYEAMAAAGK